MPTQQACIHCPNCLNYTPLPLESHLGEFDFEVNPSKDSWPIRFLCLQCKLLFGIPPEAIHLRDAETRDRNQLVRYDFASDQSGILRHFGIYTIEKTGPIPYRIVDQLVADEAIENVLKPSGLWQKSYGQRVNISIDWGVERSIPKTLEDFGPEAATVHSASKRRVLKRRIQR